MISKLKVEHLFKFFISKMFSSRIFFQAACGYEYASKIERMFQDISVSTSLISEYKTYCDNSRITDIGMDNLFRKFYLINLFSGFFCYGSYFKFMAIFSATSVFFTKRSKI